MCARSWLVLEVEMLPRLVSGEAVSHRFNCPVLEAERLRFSVCGTLTIRGIQVMLDCDLAELYGVEVKQLNPRPE